MKFTSGLKQKLVGEDTYSSLTDVLGFFDQFHHPLLPPYIDEDHIKTQMGR